MTEYQTHHNTDFGAAGSAGEPGPAAPRRPRAGKPGYVSLLENRHARRQVAGQLAIRVEQLHETGDPGTAEREAADATAELLDDLIDALRAV